MILFDLQYVEEVLAQLINFAQLICPSDVPPRQKGHLSKNILVEIKKYSCGILAYKLSFNNESVILTQFGLLASQRRCFLAFAEEPWPLEKSNL